MRLIAFCIILIALFGLDVATTNYAIDSGIAEEANPLMRGVVGSLYLFVAVKAAGLLIILISYYWISTKNIAVANIGMRIITSIMFTVVVSNLYVISASAESGSITINQEHLKIFDSINGGATANNKPNFSLIYWNTSAYSYISYIKFHSNKFVWNYSMFESDPFQIVQGGSGSGTAIFEGDLGNLTFVFDSSATFTSSPIKLSFPSDAAITNNITFTNLITICGSASGFGQQGIPYINTPAWLDCQESTGNSKVLVSTGAGSSQYQVGTRSTTTENYTVSYVNLAGVNNFHLTQTKGVVNSSINVTSSSDIIYGRETTFNKYQYEILRPYLDGLYINVSLESGAFQKVLINSSGAPTQPNIPAENIKNGVGLVWEFDEYALGAIGNISWQKTTPILNCDVIRIFDPSGIEKDFLENPGDSGFYKTFLGSVGTWKAEYRRSICGLGVESILNTAYTDVSPETPSYLLVDGSVFVGRLFNVTYKIGFFPTGASIKTYNSSDLVTPENVFFPITETRNTEIVKQIIITRPGLHYIKLCDSLLGCKATGLTVANYNGSLVTTNVTRSNISMDKSLYSYGNYYTVSYAVDNFNWSNKQVTIKSFNNDFNVEQDQSYLVKQMSSIPGVFLQSTTYPFSGSYDMRLVGTNNTGSYILANTSFTLGEVDSEGYGLSISDSDICSGETANIKVTVPNLAYLNISSDNALDNKDYVINQSKIVPYRFRTTGTYYITIHNTAKETKRLIIISVTETCPAKVTPNQTVKIGKTETELTGLMTNNIFWALLFIVGIMMTIAVYERRKE